MLRHDRHGTEHGLHPLRWIAVLGAVLILVAVVHRASGTTAESAPGRRAPGATPPAPSRGPESDEAASPAPRPHTRAGTPRRLEVPALGISAPVVPISMDGTVLTPPDDPQTLGWWSQGARPGAHRGSALITGHTVHTGGGAFDDLEHLSSGAGLRVDTNRGVVRYAVTRVTVYPKQTLTQDAARIFSQSVAGRLVLVTCEDWNGQDYESNVVVVAEPRGA